MRYTIRTAFLIVAVSVISLSAIPFLDETREIPKVYPDTPLECLAKNLYFEARGEGTIGMIAVGNVVMNRQKKTKEDICIIIHKPYQFSWTMEKLHDINEPFRFVEAVIIATKLLNHEVRDVTGGATYFHAVYVDPEWSHSMVRKRVIGNHIFYKG
jgi:spore germination cell wall hydrolase CwlJ-like protein